MRRAKRRRQQKKNRQHVNFRCVPQRSQRVQRNVIQKFIQCSNLFVFISKYSTYVLPITNRRMTFKTHGSRPKTTSLLTTFRNRYRHLRTTSREDNVRFFVQMCSRILSLLPLVHPYLTVPALPLFAHLQTNKVTTVHLFRKHLRRKTNPVSSVRKTFNLVTTRNPRNRVLLS